jgi:hypothetical protein
VDDVPELGHKHSKPPFLEIRWDLQQHNSSIIYFKNVSFSVQVTLRIFQLLAANAET